MTKIAGQLLSMTKIAGQLLTMTKIGSARRKSPDKYERENKNKNVNIHATA